MYGSGQYQFSGLGSMPGQCVRIYGVQSGSGTDLSQSVSVFLVSITLFLSERQRGKAKERSKSNALWEIREHWTEKYFRLFLEVFKHSSSCSIL
jgi:hypothetical protein